MHRFLSSVSMQPIRLIALELGIVIAVVVLLSLALSSSPASSVVYQQAFDKTKHQLTEPQLCLVGGCASFDGKTTVDDTKDVPNAQTISLLLRAAQVDDAGLVDINDGQYTIFVKDGQVKATTPASFFSFIPFFKDEKPHYHVFINGKDSATLFPFYWELVTVSFDQPFTIKTLHFGKGTQGFKGVMDDAQIATGKYDQAHAKKDLDTLLSKLKK